MSDDYYSHERTNEDLAQLTKMLADSFAPIVNDFDEQKKNLQSADEDIFELRAMTDKMFKKTG